MKFEQVLALTLLNVVPSLVGMPLSKKAGKGTTGTCPTLTAQEKMDLLKDLQKQTYEELHWTFWLIPYLQKSKETGLAPMDFNSPRLDRSTYLYGPKKCSRVRRHVDKEYDCPATYFMHNDIDRIPENIVYASCVCERCRHDNTEHAKSCQPVYTLTRVLRRKASCDFEWTYDKVPVACTCKSSVTIQPAEEFGKNDVPFVPKSAQNWN